MITDTSTYGQPENTMPSATNHWHRHKKPAKNDIFLVHFQEGGD